MLNYPEKKSIGIDMDQVLAKLNEHWLEVIREHEGENVTIEDITDWHMPQFFNCGDKIYDYLNYDLFRHLPVVEDSQEVVAKLCKAYEVYIVTTATLKPEIMVAKWEWLDEHFPFISKNNVVMCGKKDIVRTSILIDDAPHNLEGFKGKTPLLFNQPYNQKEKRFVRVKNWKHIKELLL